jgi:two-component system, OmpR family, sensor histidine kinase QseC
MSTPRSLQVRLLVLVLGMVLLLWGTAAVLTWRDASHELDELLDSHLAQAAALLVVQQADIEGDGVADAPILHRYAPKVAFQVFHEGRLALRSSNAPAWPVRSAGGPPDSGFRTVTVDGVAWRVFATHGAARDVRVYVGEQVDSRSAILRAALRGTLGPMLLALPLLALGVWWAVARGLAPLRALGASLAARPADDLRPLESGTAPTEMLPMLAALNGLFARIAALLDAERRFTADAAHELRTPIAAIRAQAQVALAEADDALRRDALRHTIEGCDRATRLVEQLLTLARIEAERAPARQRLDLAAIVQATVAEIGPGPWPRSSSWNWTPTPDRSSRATRRCCACSYATWSTTRCATARGARASRSGSRAKRMRSCSRWRTAAPACTRRTCSGWASASSALRDTTRAAAAWAGRSCDALPRLTRRSWTSRDARRSAASWCG